ncbi:hypothetical protein AMECASPLE_026932 [Ameca splendens]|uniref:Uncharacterized protein n=1 Tax=Ameca splendens TaxID=208324 RepID=A0ABV0YS30_9TELE
MRKPPLLKKMSERRLPLNFVKEMDSNVADQEKPHFWGQNRFNPYSSMLRTLRRKIMYTGSFSFCKMNETASFCHKDTAFVLDLEGEAQNPRKTIPKGKHKRNHKKKS